MFEKFFGRKEVVPETRESRDNEIERQGKEEESKTSLEYFSEEVGDVSLYSEIEVRGHIIKNLKNNDPDVSESDIELKIKDQNQEFKAKETPDGGKIQTGGWTRKTMYDVLVKGEKIKNCEVEASERLDDHAPDVYVRWIVRETPEDNS